MKRKGVNLENLITEIPLEEAVRLAIEDDSAISGTLFEQDIMEDADIPMLDFSGCALRRVRLGDIRARRTHFSNCRLEDCDLSGLTFRDGTMIRAEFVRCRLSGCMLDRMKMEDVLFQDCRMNYLTLSGCRIKRVEFDSCDLSRAMMMESQQQDLTLNRCILNGAEIQSLSMKGVDLSSCELGQISINPELLRGASIGLTQAPAILALFGIQVKV